MNIVVKMDTITRIQNLYETLNCDNTLKKKYTSKYSPSRYVYEIGQT